MRYRVNQYSEASDNELFSLIEKGDEGAFTRVYEKYHKLLYVVAYRHLMNREMAEDIVQHVFVRLWEFRSVLSVNVSLKNYLFTMTKNCVLDQIRNDYTALSKNYEILQRKGDYEDDLVEKLEKKELLSLFYEAVALLPTQKRDICLMKVRDELSNKDIAGKLGLSVNTIKAHYSEALKLLRVHLNKMLIIVGVTTLIAFLSVNFTA